MISGVNAIQPTAESHVDAICRLAMAQDEQGIKDFLQTNHISIDITNAQGMTPLAKLVSEKFYSGVSFLIAKFELSKNDALMHSLSFKCDELTLQLLQDGASPYMAVMNAASMGNIALTNKIIGFDNSEQVIKHAAQAYLDGGQFKNANRIIEIMAHSSNALNAAILNVVKESKTINIDIDKLHQKSKCVKNIMKIYSIQFNYALAAYKKPLHVLFAQCTKSDKVPSEIYFDIASKTLGLSLSDTIKLYNIYMVTQTNVIKSNIEDIKLQNQPANENLSNTIYRYFTMFSLTGFKNSLSYMYQTTRSVLGQHSN